MKQDRPPFNASQNALNPHRAGTAGLLQNSSTTQSSERLKEKPRFQVRREVPALVDLAWRIGFAFVLTAGMLIVLVETSAGTEWMKFLLRAGSVIIITGSIFWILSWMVTRGAYEMYIQRIQEQEVRERLEREEAQRLDRKERERLEREEHEQLEKEEQEFLAAQAAHQLPAGNFQPLEEDEPIYAPIDIPEPIFTKAKR